MMVFDLWFQIIYRILKITLLNHSMTLKLKSHDAEDFCEIKLFPILVKNY